MVSAVSLVVTTHITKKWRSYTYKLAPFLTSGVNIFILKLS